MQNVVKFPLGLLVLLSTGASSQLLDARMHHLWFDDSSFFDNSWFDRALELQEKSMATLKERLSNFGLPKEQQEALKTAQAQLDAVKQEISEDAHKVTIRFSGLEQVDKKDIKIVKKKHGWSGIITLKQGTVEFFITKNGINIVRRIELTKEETDQKKKSVFYSSSSAAESDFFEGPINIQTVKVESLKDNTLSITAEKKKEEILPIP